MGDKPPSSNSAANVAVRFDLSKYTAKLAGAFGCYVEGAERGSIRVSRGSGDPCHPVVDYVFDELMSKFDDKSSERADERWQACLSRFWEAEDLCRDTNWRFRDKGFLRHRVLSDALSAGSVFNRAAQKISWLLGPLEDADVTSGCGFGPGATTRLPRARSHRAYKMWGKPQATLQTTPLVADYVSDAPGWGTYLCVSGPPYEIVSGNNVVAVPKNFKTDRMIAIEPDWNIFLQKGIGAHIRRRLKGVGMDLNNQETNGFLAGLGSITGELATIDLSMASDCVSRELVRYLLPPDWVDLLEQVRSPVGHLPSGEIVTYQKFSSMGNGFTFELESLIFWALCSTVVELMRLEDRRVYVYGDDIIVPTEAYAEVIRTLTLAGFQPNPKKSFSSGPFRESCGQHWYNGDLVTPIYIRESVDTLDRLFLLHNNTARLLERLRPYLDTTPEYIQEFLAWIRSHAPRGWQKPRLPRLDIGDGAFYGTFELSLPRRSKRRDRRTWYGWEIEVLSPRIKPDERRPDGGYLLSCLWQLEHPVSLSLRLSQAAYGEGYSLLEAIARQDKCLPDDVVSTEWMRVVGRSDVPKWTLYWTKSKQIVRSLEADYCWWEC